MKIIKFISILPLLLLMQVAIADGEKISDRMKTAEIPVEGPFYGFYLGPDLTGHVKSKDCAECKQNLFKITPDVMAFLDSKPVSLKQFVRTKLQPDTVFLYADTKKVKRISWVSKK